MHLGGLWWTNVLNLALPPQRHRPDAQPEHQDPVIHTAQNKREKKRKKEREQPNQKTNPPVVTSARNYTKKKKETDRKNPRTDGKSTAIQTKSHTEAYTYTLTEREKGKIYIYSCFRCPPSQFVMIRCLFRYSTAAGYIKLIVEI